MPRASSDALENLSKETPRQVSFGELQGETPGMPDEAATRLEQPLLETRERPVLDSDGQHQPTQEIVQVVGDDAQEQPHLVGSKPVTGEASPVGGRLALSSTQWD